MIFEYIFFTRAQLTWYDLSIVHTIRNPDICKLKVSQILQIIFRLFKFVGVMQNYLHIVFQGNSSASAIFYQKF